MWQISREILWHLVSISSTLNIQFFLYKRRFGSFYYIHVTREKLPKQHSYENFVNLMLVKLTACVQSLHNIVNMISIQKNHVLAILTCSTKWMKIKVWTWNYGLGKKCVRVLVHERVCEYCRQSHQRLTYKFFVRMSFLQFRVWLWTNFCTKNARV